MTSSFHLRPASIRLRTALCAVLCLPAVAPAQPPTQKPTQAEVAHEPSKRQRHQAEKAYLEGARLLERNDLTGAQKQFDRALQLNPANHDYLMARMLVREHRVTELVQQAGKAHLLGQQDKADALLAQAQQLDPQNQIVTQHLPSSTPRISFQPESEPWMRQVPALAGPITLQPASGRHTFHLHADIQSVLQQVISSYGIRPVFDDSVVHQDVRFNLENTTYDQAVPILLQMGGLFSVPLDNKSVIIAKDTPENRERLERLLQETIHIPAMTSQEINELGTIVRNIFDIKQLTVEKTLGDLVLRAPEETLNAVNLTLADLIDGDSQVMIEVKLYAIDKTRQRDIGLQPPQQVGIYSVSSEASKIVRENQDLVNQAIAQGLVPAGASNIEIALALIGSGLVKSTLLSSTIGFVGGGLTQVGITSNVFPTLHLALNSSDSRALDDIQIRIGDRQTAEFRVGTRYPITTSTYSTGVTANASALQGVNINGTPASSLLNQLGGASNGLTIPQIQYEDLGLTLKAIPVIQKSGVITLHLDMKVEALSGTALNNIPILASRQFVSDITVDDGKSAMLASTLSRSESAAVSGIPGLGELPGFQSTTAEKVTNYDSSELVVLITPHIIRRRSSITVGPRIALTQPLQQD